MLRRPEANSTTMPAGRRRSMYNTTMRRSLLLAPLFLAITTFGFCVTQRALLVGIDQYIPPEPAKASHRNWTDLDGAVNDAEEMAQLLIGRYGFAPENVIVLHNSEATRDHILSTIRTHLLEHAAPGDVSVFFYAGHGSQVV